MRRAFRSDHTHAARPSLSPTARSANFYGKRKSNFYGQDDEFKKKDPRVADAQEDYRGNKGGSYFVRAARRAPRCAMRRGPLTLSPSRALQVWDKDLDAPLTKKQARMKKAGKLVLDEE